MELLEMREEAGPILEMRPVVTPLKKLVVVATIVVIFAVGSMTIYSGHEQGAMFFVLWLALTSVYSLPSLVAMARGHHNLMAIVILNIFLGWTFLGWVLALVWAATEVRKTS